MPPLTSTPRFSFPPPPAPLGLAPFPIKVSWASSPALAPLLSLLVLEKQADRVRRVYAAGDHEGRSSERVEAIDVAAMVEQCLGGS